MVDKEDAAAVLNCSTILSPENPHSRPCPLSTIGNELITRMTLLWFEYRFGTIPYLALAPAATSVQPPTARKVGIPDAVHRAEDAGTVDRAQRGCRRYSHGCAGDFIPINW